MKAVLALALLAAMPAIAHADPIATGPFYLPYDATTMDRADIIAVVANAHKLTSGTIFLCSTSASMSGGMRQQEAVRAELIVSGVPSSMVRLGKRCVHALRRPAVLKTKTDAIVIIVGPSGR